MISLSHKSEDVLPEGVTSGGVYYPIDPNFHTVLACLRVLGDPEKSESRKVLYMIRRFFLGTAPPVDMGAAFSDFIRDGETSEDDGEQLMDFELDAGAIYASFRQQYSIDLLTTDMHWYVFRALMQGLGEGTPFGQRVRIRGMDINDVPEKERGKLRKLKDTLAIQPKMSKEESDLKAELDRRLAAGEDPTDILQQLQEV